MSISVLVNGAFGRMGQIATKAIQSDPDFELVGQTGREYDLGKSIKDSKAQIVIDFTNPDSVFKNVKTIIAQGAHPVIGTTGLTQNEIKTLEEQCKKIKLGGIIAPNFSLGAVLMMKHAREMAKYMPYVEIIEMHHSGKADSPSGTAIRTAELIAEANPELQPAHTPTQETIPGTRGGQHLGIPIHAIRLPGYLAHEQIIFGNPGETLTLRHDSIDRQCFMPGLLVACRKVMALDRLVYGLEQII